MSIKYHEVTPTNNKIEYTDDDLVDFEFLSNGRDLVKNSIELSGTFQLFKTVSGTQTRVLKADAGKVFLDNNAGIHSIIENVSCSTLNQGSIENIGFSYPRFVSMMNVLKKRSQDKNNISDVLEWKYADKDVSNVMLRQGLVTDNTQTQLFDQSFNFKPLIVFNRTDQNISFSKTGSMRISMNLSTVQKMIEDRLTVANLDNLSVKISADGQHNEDFWKSEFLNVVTWLFKNTNI